MSLGNNNIKMLLYDFITLIFGDTVTIYTKENFQK